jgi:hypothetical protein
MSHIPYPYKQVHPRRFVFHSVGIKSIEKVVEFTPVGFQNMVNLGFGDLRPDGYFTARYPETVILFEGSTEERSRLYQRILRNYYPNFKQEFALHALKWDKENFRVVPFDPSANEEYSAYLIKRIV